MLHSATADLTPGGLRATLCLSAEYLVQFEVAHEQLLKAMAEMAAVTGVAVPDKERFTTARWRIAKASLDRLALWDKVSEYLSPRVGAVTRKHLSTLAAENIEIREAASAIIARWSLQAIEADWPGYCNAARQIRCKQMSIVRHEQRGLLPLLQHLSRS